MTAPVGTPIRLPPLTALRVFQTVVRHRSFRGAADELRVTPQAVSLQIRHLEDFLAFPLFDRKGRAVEPNEQAILLAHHVQAGFDEIAEGLRRVTKPRRRSRITVNVSPYFAARYLLDRLARFREIMPDADLRLTTMADLPDFVADEVDVAIQWGFGDWKPNDQLLLVPDMKEICCTPDLALRLDTPADLLSAPLLHPVLYDRLWANILSHLGVEGADAPGDIRIQDAATMRRATLTGLGVGLLSTAEALEDLNSGRLVAPFGLGLMQRMPAPQIPGFYLVLPKSHRRVPPVAAFCRWVEAEDWSTPQ